MRELGEREALAPPLEEAAGEPDGIEDGSCDAPARQPLDLAVEEPQVEARVVGDQRRLSGEAQKLPDGDRRAGGRPQVGRADPGERGDVRREERAGVDERLERLHDLELVDANGADLTHAVAAGREARRLEVEDDELGVLDRSGPEGLAG